MPICLVTTKNRNKKSRSTALEFQDCPGISMVFQDLYLFPGLSRPGILNNKISGLSRICTNPDDSSFDNLYAYQYGNILTLRMYTVWELAYCARTQIRDSVNKRAWQCLSLSSTDYTKQSAENLPKNDTLLIGASHIESLPSCNLRLLGMTPDPPSSGTTRTACHQSASSSPTMFRMCPNLNSRPRPGSPASHVGS